MARLYSQELWHLEGGGAGVFTSGSPGEGFIWVIRDISFYLYVDYAYFLGNDQFQFATHEANNVFWGIPPGFVQPNRSYHWEGRKVVQSDDEIYFVTGSPQWQFAVSGYLLSTP